MILVTGATGMVGSQLLADLAGAGRPVRAMKRKDSPMGLVHRAFRKDPAALQQVQWTDGDVSDLFSLDMAMAGIREVYHCAALVSFRSSDYRLLMKTNAEGTAHVVDAALAAGVERFCHVSSTAALGRTEENTLITEDTSWKNSRHNSAYAISKFQAECEVWRGMEEGLPGFVVNPSIVLGPGSTESGSAALFGAVQKGLRFYPPGSSGFVDVRDVSRCMIGLMEKKVTGQRYIVNAGNHSYRDVLECIASCFGKKAPAVPVSPWLSEIGWRAAAFARPFSGRFSMLTRETARNGQRHWLYSNEKIRKELEMDFIPLRRSVEDTCSALKL